MADTSYSKDKKDQPDYENKAYQYMSKTWQRTSDVWGGIRCLRESKEKYLRQFTRESDKDHAARLAETEFYNVFGSTVDTIVGMICSNDIAPTEAPPAIAEMLPDVDLCGNDFASFIRTTATNGIRDGHSFIFVDAPPPPKPKEDGSRPTLADVADRRAFWVNYRADQLINWQFQIIDGKLIFTQLTFRETTCEPDGVYGEQEITRYRVLRRGTYSLYEKRKREGVAEEIVSVVENAPRGVDDITVAVFYADKKGPLESCPPFEDLMETNVTHFNSQSVLREALKYIVPMPVFKIGDKADAADFQSMTMASNRSVIMWGEGASAEYLELKGQSIPELRTDIENLERRMAKLGVEKFAPVVDGTNKTAMEVGSDNRKEMSAIAVMAANLETCVEQAFYFTAEVTNAMKGAGTINLGEAEKAKLKLNIEYDKLTYSIDQLEFLNKLVDSGRLSLQSFLEMLPRVTSLPKGYDAAMEAKRIIEEREGKGTIDDFDARIDRALKLDGIISHREQLKIIYPEKSDSEIDAMVDAVAATEAVRQAEAFANG